MYKFILPLFPSPSLLSLALSFPLSPPSPVCVLLCFAWLFIWDMVSHYVAQASLKSTMTIFLPLTLIFSDFSTISSCVWYDLNYFKSEVPGEHRGAWTEVGSGGQTHGDEPRGWLNQSFRDCVEG